jgi:hypothetical protein
MTDSIQMPISMDCMGRTCLKWGSDGELTALDLCLVLERLAQVDPEMTALHQESLEVRPCPSMI